MLHRFLPVVLIILSFLYLFFNFQTLKRDFVYKLGIANDKTLSCCTEEEILKADGEFDENPDSAVFNNQKINYPKTSLAYAFNQNIIDSMLNSASAVLGTTTQDGREKWIEVSLDEQMLRAWEGDSKVMEFPISSGKWSKTPKGNFTIWYKTRSQSMIGGSKELGTYYNLPNVPHNMFFYKGYAIHGAYWHNNFGQPMSHGCVNSPLASVGPLFEWVGPVVPSGQKIVRASVDNPGTRVYIH